MELELLEKEIKDRVEFLETRYDIYVWKLTDDELEKFLKMNYEMFFKDKSLSLFFTCMIEYFNSLFDDVMSDSHVVVNKEYLVSRLYYLQLIYNKYKVNADAYSIVHNLKEVYGLENRPKILTRAV